MIWCLHGAVGQAGDWDEFSKVMASQGRPCRAVELWRFLECEGMTLVEWAAAFNAEVDAAGEEENVLVGYSMGGRLALHALLDSPELWHKAVIVSVHPGLLDEGEKLQRMASDAEWAGLALTSDWKQFLRRWDAQGVLQSGGRVDAPKNSDPRVKLVNRRRAIARSFMEWSLGKQNDLREEFRKVSCPVLWMTGEKDEKFTELAKYTVSLFPNGQHRKVVAGHRLPWEEPEKFGKVVEEFLSEV